MISLGLVFHFYNEELLLPGFIKHHLEIFDSVIAIDHHSTDSSREIIKNLSPDWKIITSKLGCFDAVKTDQEVMECEQLLTTDWKQALNVTEWIWNPKWKETIEHNFMYNPGVSAFCFKSYCLVDNDLNLPIMDPLFTNHTWGYIDHNFGVNVPRHMRFVHNQRDGQYTPGRHSMYHQSIPLSEPQLIHWTFAPWPQSVDRKMQIQHRIPNSDRQEGKGVQHIQTFESLDITYKNHLNVSDDLLKISHFAGVYNEFLNR